MNTPQLGDGATLRVGSDCYPYTVIEFLNWRGTRILVQADIADPAPGCDHFTNQVYTYRRDPNGPTEIYTLRKNGRYHAAGASMKSSSLSIGARRYYQDPSF